MKLIETDIQKLKSELREKMRAALADVSVNVRLAGSIELNERLQAQMASARTILFYAPLQDELDVWPVMELSVALGTTCALPFFDVEKQIYGARVVSKLATDIVVGKFGLREPAVTCAEISLNQFDLVLVPGMAFDLQGNRLGRGRGFYDRILAEASGIKCGICYDGQLLEKIPTEPHDAKVGFILTPSRVVRRKA